PKAPAKTVATEREPEGGASTKEVTAPIKTATEKDPADKNSATNPQCVLTGDKLFLIDAISAEPDFANPVTVPDAFVDAALSIPSADAGVNIDQANRTKKRIKYLAHRTFTKGVLSEIGGFGGLFAVDKTKYADPILVSSVDGVGTKLKLAFEMNVHHTIGADLVNHCVNDIAVQGAAPMFFMDYLATGKLDPQIAEKVVEGIAEACKHNGCALIGGETAE